MAIAQDGLKRGELFTLHFGDGCYTVHAGAMPSRVVRHFLNPTFVTCIVDWHCPCVRMPSPLLGESTVGGIVKFFLDTADLDEIAEAASWGVLAGVTTNPSLYARIGGRLDDFENHIKRICEIVDGPVSAESVSMTRDEIVADGRRLAALAPNVVVKVPTMVEGLAATRELASEGIKVNMTLCFTVPQAIMAARSGAAFISPFIGRFDDISETGLDHLGDIIEAVGNYDFGHPVEIIAASVRSANHVAEAALMGADIATVPFKVLKKCVEHPLTDRGLDSFLADWEKVKNA